MKKLFSLLLLVLPCLVSGYSWHRLGPSGIQVNDVCFNAGQGRTIICTSTGIVVSEPDMSGWTPYTLNGMPVVGAVALDADRVLLAMGNGSPADGIYTFHLTTHVFVQIDALASPTFIQTGPPMTTYYAGSASGGLKKSADGINWTVVPEFDGQPIVSLTFNDIWMVLSKGFLYQPIYRSADAGATWSLLSGNGFYISYLAYHPSGRLYGVIPYSNSASLRYSTDNGYDWTLGNWADNIRTVGFDVMGTVLAGFRSAAPPMGIARFDTLTSTFTFLNEGLPNTFVNRIRTNPVLSSITIFLCTDDGVFYSNDYLTGLTDPPQDAGGMGYTLSPNPLTGQSLLKVTGVPSSEWLQAEFTDLSGRVLLAKRFCGALSLLRQEFAPGLYLFRVIRSSGEMIRGKMVANGRW